MTARSEGPATHQHSHNRQTRTHVQKYKAKTEKQREWVTMMISPSLSKPWKMGKGCSRQQEQQGQRFRVRAGSACSSKKGTGSRTAGRSGRTGEKVGLRDCMGSRLCKSQEQAFSSSSEQRKWIKGGSGRDGGGTEVRRRDGSRWGGQRPRHK